MPKVIIAILVIVLGAAGAWYWYDSGSADSRAARSLPPPPTMVGDVDPEPAPEVAPAPAAADPYAQWQGEGGDAVEPEPAVAVAAPDSIDGSDQRFVAAVADLSAVAGKWFVPEQQVRKWVVTVDLLADGDLPGRNRPLAVQAKRFSANRIGESDIWELDNENYGRYTPLVNAFTAIEPENVAAYYRAWLPLFERGYDELGKRGDFDSRLKLAIARIQSVKPLQGGVRLKRPGVMYVYADAEMEAAPGVDKLMWRLGPENLAKIQAYLERLEPLL